MRALRFIQKWWREFWGWGIGFPVGVDSHKWESKMELLRINLGIYRKWPTSVKPITKRLRPR